MRLPKLTPHARLCLGGAFIFLMFGGFLFPWMIWSHGRVDAMLAWPAIEAKIVAADTTAVYRRGMSVRYRHKLTYRFVVSGQTYTGDRVSYGNTPPQWLSETEARKALPRIGSTIMIRYNPRQPDDNVIHVLRTPEGDEQMLRWLAGGLGAIGALVVLVAGAAWRRELRQGGAGKVRA
jgi:hypothetical protein